MVLKLIAALLLCLIGGLAGDGRGGVQGEGEGGDRQARQARGEGVVEEEGIVANCTTRVMSAEMGHRQGYLSLYLIIRYFVQNGLALIQRCLYTTSHVLYF